MNVNLVFLTMQSNQIKRLEGLKHLKKLSFLDVSQNQIGEFDVAELPENIMIMKMVDNPCTKLEDYRKNVVVHLNLLEEFDRIKVIQAERLHYRGLIRIDVGALIEKYRLERKEKDMKAKIEKEMYLDYMEEMGVSSSDRMIKSLNEFGKIDEFIDLHKSFKNIIDSHTEKSDI